MILFPDSGFSAVRIFYIIAIRFLKKSLQNVHMCRLKSENKNVIFN